VNKIRQNFSIVGADGQLYYIGTFDGTRNSMTDLLMLDFGVTGHIRTRTEAKTANFENGEWVLYSVIQREFDEKDDEVRTQTFEKMAIDIKEKPADFLKEQKEAQTMRLKDLQGYIRHLHQIGSDSHKEEVYLYYRFASPFGCLILALLGVPWGWTMRKYTGAALSFFISLIAGLVYVGGTVIGRGLGESGILNPLLSVWIVNIAFAGMTPLIFAWKDR
jgi:lipopolysaccharide export system permease protein